MKEGARPRRNRDLIAVADDPPPKAIPVLEEPAIRALELLAGTGVTLGRVACEDELRSLRGNPAFEALFDQPTATACE